MFRSHACGGLVPRTVARVPAAALLTPLRRYTPIYAAEPAADHLKELRTQDECHALWAQHIPVPTLSRAIELWLRFGNDPVVHADAMRPPPAVSPASASPFAYVEDYMGTNMVTGSADHVKESAELWSTFFETKYLRRMRHSRRTSRQYIGVLKSSSGGDAGSAAALFQDEADNPNTKWSSDTFFREVAYLGERHLKMKATNYLQLEKALWAGGAEVEGFVQFFEAFQQQTVTRVPLPVPSIWVYESAEAKRKWAEKYLPICSAAHAFFAEKLRPHAGDAAAQQKLLADVAAAYAKVHAVLLERRARQEKAGLCPTSWAGGAHRSAEEPEEAWVANEVEKAARGVEEGVFDPEDLLDSTPEWNAEHAKIQEVLSAPIAGGSYGFTLQDFWLHTERREAVETLHVLESETLARVAAAAHRRLYAETSLRDIFAGLEESVAKGRLDLRAAVLKPHFNSVWCRVHYVKFGGSSLVQHTHTASRELLFHYAASVQEVAAAAQLYYATKPLSSQLDYASPYTLRRSLARLCSLYGVDMTHAAQQPMLMSAAYLAQAEGVIGRVVRHVSQAFGQRRRARLAAARANNQRLLSAVKSVHVTAPAPELLPAGADLRSVLREEKTKKAAPAAAETLKVWPLGSRQTVSFDWAPPAVERLRLLNLTDRSLTAEQAAQREALRASGRAEISLWRRRTPAERQRATAAATQEAAQLSAQLEATPSLREIATYAQTLFTQLTRESPQPSAAANASAAEDPEWVFAVMLNDNVALSETQSAEVFLPYTDAAGNRLPSGEYRVVVRGIDREVNPTEHPALTSEGVSASFSVTDALPQLYAQYTGAATKPGEEAALEGDVAGAELIPLCAFLRDAGLHVPLSAEFAVGQSLDREGRFSLAELAAALRGSRHHRSLSEEGITDAQRGIEADCRAHWALYHPAATEDEWASARRRVLNRAMADERDWWVADALLDTVDVRTGSASAPALEFAAFPAADRYGAELCAVLPAQGSNHEDYAVLPTAPGVRPSAGAAGGGRLQADCTVDGTGALTSLHFGAPISEADVTMEEALRAATEAIQVAQARHATLSMVKLGAYKKSVQTALFCGVQGLEFGGKYARTYAYAADKAKRELAETALAGYVPTERVLDAERLRVSEQDVTSPTVDRFASETNPEQRLTRFAKRVNLDGYSAEEPTPDATSTWGQ